MVLYSTGVLKLLFFLADRADLFSKFVREGLRSYTYPIFEKM